MFKVQYHRGWADDRRLREVRIVGQYPDGFDVVDPNHPHEIWTIFHLEVGPRLEVSFL